MFASSAVALSSRHHCLTKFFFFQNLPLNNPVLIVEVLVNRQAQADEDSDVNRMKFTFGKEDLREVRLKD